MNFLFFDTETTGKADFSAPPCVSHKWPRLVQLGLILANDKGEELKRANVLVRPDGYTIPEEVVAIHGITTEKATKEGYPLKKVMNAFSNTVLQADFIVGHNVMFDRGVMLSEYYRTTEPLDEHLLLFERKKSICTMIAGRGVAKISTSRGYKNPKLIELYQHLFNRSFEGAHDAMNDVIATKECFYAMSNLEVFEFV